MSVAVAGEVRVYVGGRYLQLIYGTVWVRGAQVMRGRYHNKDARRKLIKKAVEAYGDVDVYIVPDIPELTQEEEENLWKEAQ